MFNCKFLFIRSNRHCLTPVSKQELYVVFLSNLQFPPPCSTSMLIILKSFLWLNWVHCLNTEKGKIIPPLNLKYYLFCLRKRKETPNTDPNPYTRTVLQYSMMPMYPTRMLGLIFITVKFHNFRYAQMTGEFCQIFALSSVGVMKGKLLQQKLWWQVW